MSSPMTSVNVKSLPKTKCKSCSTLVPNIFPYCKNCLCKYPKCDKPRREHYDHCETHSFCKTSDCPNTHTVDSEYCYDCSQTHNRMCIVCRHTKADGVSVFCFKCEKKRPFCLTCKQKKIVFDTEAKSYVNKHCAKCRCQGANCTKAAQPDSSYCSACEPKTCSNCEELLAFETFDWCFECLRPKCAKPSCDLKVSYNKQRGEFFSLCPSCARPQCKKPGCSNKPFYNKRDQEYFDFCLFCCPAVGCPGKRPEDRSSKYCTECELQYQQYKYICAKGCGTYTTNSNAVCSPCEQQKSS